METAASQVPGIFRDGEFPVERKEREKRLFRISEHYWGYHYGGERCDSVS